MKNNCTVFTQGSLITFTQLHGRTASGATGDRPARNCCVVKYRYSDSFGFLLVIFLMGWFFCAGLRASEADQLEAGEISAYAGAGSIRHSFTTTDGDLQTGAKVFIGDEIETTANGSLELLLGTDIRIRLGGGTVIRVNNREVSERESGDLKITTTVTEVLLRKGEIRVRVRENLVTPTPVRVLAANLQLLLPRSDCLIRRAGEGPENLRQIEILLGWGRCATNIKFPGDKNWLPETATDLSAPGGALVPELPESSYLLRWEITGQEATDRKLQKLPFSIDQLRQPPKEIPKSDPEMEGA